MTDGQFGSSGRRQRQTLAVLAYVGVVVVLAASSLWLIDDLRVRSRGIAAAQERLDQLTQHSRRRPPASIGSDASVSGSPFLDARTITIAGAAMEQRVGAAVAKAGGALISSQVELDGPEAKNGFVSVEVASQRCRRFSMTSRPGCQIFSWTNFRFNRRRTSASRRAGACG
jgi:general secretion pathway protein M